MVDALELASKHLSADDDIMIEQSLQITEGAVLVYDVRDRETLESVKRIVDVIYRSIGDRGYALTLVGNKSDTDDERRAVPWALGSKTASYFRLPGNASLMSFPTPPHCAFMEVSAKTGENIAKIFPILGKEALRLRQLKRQRREQAEKAIELAQARGPSAALPLKRKKSLWKSLTSPFSRR